VSTGKRGVRGMRRQVEERNKKSLSGLDEFFPVVQAAGANPELQIMTMKE
jgi:hypothetical protein